MGWRWYWKSWEKCEALVHSSWRLTQSILLIGTLLPLTLVIWKLYAGSPHDARTAPVVSWVAPPRGNAIVAVTDSGMVLRQMLPYSVIPGGAQDAAELRNAIAHDPVVATHYIAFDVAKTHVVHLDHDELMYVSYRMGDRVYWTNKKLMIFRGEALLSDGQHLARTRCGNRLSDTSEAPTSFRQPSAAALETPPPPELEAIAAPPPELPLSPVGPLAPPASETPSGPGTPPGGGVLPPPIVPVFCCGPGGPSGPGKPSVPPPPPRTPTPSPTPTPGPTPSVPPPPPPPVIPEPSSLLLLGAGLGAVGYARRKFAVHKRNLR